MSSLEIVIVVGGTGGLLLGLLSLYLAWQQVPHGK